MKEQMSLVSQKFSKLIKDGKLEEALQVARQQVIVGAQIIDINIPSSRLTSIICAPLITCCRATCNASSSFPSLISFENFGEPVTFCSFTDVDKIYIVVDV